MRNRIKNSVILICLSIFIFCCSSTQKNDDQTITKFVNNLAIKNESNIYENIKIGNQVWLKKNLNVSKFNNGDNIVEAKTAEEWKAANIGFRPAWCYYNYDSASGVRYGKLYNWFAVYDKRGLAPNGYRIPTFSDWTELQQFLGGRLKAGNKLKSNTEWKYRKIDDKTHINESGFNAYPTGIRDFYGNFSNSYQYSFFWCFSHDSIVRSFVLLQNCTFFNECIFNDSSYSKIEEKFAFRGHGMSIRCIKKLN